MKKPLLYFFLAVISLLLLRPVTLYTLETYLSYLLETDVQVKALHLLKGELQATLKKKKNLAIIKLNTLFPLQADFSYHGNSDAFEAYFPVKGLLIAEGEIVYSDTLKIDGKLSFLGGESLVKVSEADERWRVSAQISQLDLAQLKIENNLSAAISGLVNGAVDFQTEGDSLISLTSDRITLEDEVMENVKLQLSKADEDIYAWTTFDAKNFESRGIWFHYDQDQSRFDGRIDLLHKQEPRELRADLEGNITASQLYAKAGIHLGSSVIEIMDFVYDSEQEEASAELDINLADLEQNGYLHQIVGVDLQGDFLGKGKLEYKDKAVRASLRSQSLGGDLALSYKDGSFKWKAEAVELGELLYLLGSDAKASARLDSEGLFDGDHIDAKLSSSKISVADEEIKDLAIRLQGGLQSLKAKMHLNTPYGNVESADLDVKDLDTLHLEANLSTPYTSKPIAVKADAHQGRSKSTLAVMAISSELALSLSDTEFQEGRLHGGYTALIEPEFSGLKEKLDLKGNFSYDKGFEADMQSSLFGGKLALFISGNRLRMNASALRTESVLESLNQPLYAKGVFDLKAEGTIEKMAFGISSKRLHLDKSEIGSDENLSVDIQGEVTSESITLFPIVTNRYLDVKKGRLTFVFADKSLSVALPLSLRKGEKRFDLLLDAKADLKEGIKAELGLTRKRDSLNFDSLVYKDGVLYSNLKLDIKELHEYKDVSGQELYGPLLLKGTAGYEAGKAKLSATTDSFKGKLSLALQENVVQVDLDRLSSVEVERLFKQTKGKGKGQIDGTLRYDLEKKKGYTQLSARDVEIEGIDIDKSIRELHDMLGLNFYAMGKGLITQGILRKDELNLSTEIQYLELDTQITPELIISKDIAMATKNSRFAIHTRLKHNGDIEAFDVAILDAKGCAILTQKLTGNIANPNLANTTGTAVVVLGQAPKSILDTGGKILDAGASVIDSTASFIWEKALRQKSKVTLVQDTLTQGGNVFAFGKDILVSGECTPFYTGKVKHPE